MTAIIHLLLLVSLPLFLTGNQVFGVGINYGTIGANLPSPKKVAQMLQTTLIDKVKIYNTDPSILQAFSNTGIDIIVTLENQQITNLSRTPTAAADWFSARIAPFLPSTSVVAIAVGNEVLTASSTSASSSAAIGTDLVQAMKNLNAVLVERGLDRKIKISTPHSMAILSSSFPPSSSTFAGDLIPVMTSLLQFISDTGSTFMINAYPYFAYRDNPSQVNLEYALLGKATGVKDPKGFVYTNMLDAQIDAIRSAISALGFGGTNRSIPITVSESGWPSKGDSGNTAATNDNARIYNTRLIERAESSSGTPMKPKDKIDVFVFALFNENEKKGSVEERNFGIFNGDGSKVYEMDLSCRFCSSGGGISKEVVGSSLRGGSVWCVAKPHADEGVLQGVLDFCCGAGGVDCEEINEGGGCYAPDKVHAHASFAMNAYYHSHGRNYWNCDFKGAGLVTFSDPSFGTCRYPQL